MRRRRGSRWQRTYARAGASHLTGIHNFLTNSWTDQEALSASRVNGTPTMTAEGNANFAAPAADRVASMAPYSNAPASGAPSSNASSSKASSSAVAGGTASAEPAAERGPAAQPGAVAMVGAPVAPATPEAVQITNPLVAAYVTSLADYGFDPANQGFIVETMNGDILGEYNADKPFNPASVVKVATSLTAIAKLGPDFRFRTMLYTDGNLEPATGTIHGSLYVMGASDPAFFTENAYLIADQLNRHGIRAIDGNLVVEGKFYFNFSASSEAPAKALRAALAPEASVVNSDAYRNFLMMRTSDLESVSVGDSALVPNTQTAKSTAAASQTGAPVAPDVPSLKISGETRTQPGINTAKLNLLAIHTSLPLIRVLKGQNDFSNNWMATMIGDLVGGPGAVDRFLEGSVGLKADEISIATSSGLGSNYISPRAMASIMRKLIGYLTSHNIGLEELLPVAGIDHGTLERRFTDAYRGSVVAKTGTLHAVSALAGVAYTKAKGPLVFVIFNHGGSPATFRSAQDETIKKLISLSGGPAPIRYPSR